jgi:CheY-like chemotaxis protein/HPt (histidine-containing phosphotransfer) domain-containing protein
MMPGADGFWVAEEIHRRAELDGTVIIMLSSASDAEARARSREAGIRSYVAKPIKQSDLLDRIVSVVATVAAHEIAPDLQPCGEPVSGRSLRILLAEDNAVNQRLAVRILEKRSHSVRVASSGRQALEAVSEEPFDILLMDVQMPEMDGFEATAAIRMRERHRGGHLPIVAMTAHAMKGDRERCLAAGMDGYVTKPLEVANLLRTIDSLVPAPTRASVPDGSPAADPVEEPIDRDMLMCQVEGDLDLMREIVELFLDQTPGLMREMRTSLSRGDPATLATAAHTLKGSAGNIGAHPAYMLVAEVELAAKRGDLQAASGALKELEAEVDRLQFALEALREERAE